MRVGMNRPNTYHYYGKQRVPHACGDEPAELEDTEAIQECSPCVWG